MFFFAYLGTDENLPDWRRAVERHAAWLGLTAHLQSRRITDGGVFAFGWVSLRPPDTSALVRETTDRIALVTMQPLEPWDGTFVPPKEFETGAIQMEVSLRSGQVRVAMPAVTTEQFFWAADARGWALGNDMRLLIRWAGFELDEVGAHGLFKYDIIPAPLTLSQTIHRIPEGHLLTVRRGWDKPRLEVTFEPPSSPAAPFADDSVEHVRQALDGILALAPKSSTLLFSGGIDSGLMAARLAALGRTDVTLLNFTSGPEDVDGQYAPSMARHLGLRFEQVGWHSSDMVGVLHNLGADFGFPFSDTAVIPSLLLVQRLGRSEPPTPALLEGSLTSAFFAKAEELRRWSRIYSIPWVVRRLIGLACPLGLWPYRSKVARVAATMHYTADLPFAIGASYIYMSASGMAYRVGREAEQALADVMQARLDVFSAARNPIDRASLVALQRATMSTAKFFDPARRRGIASIFPFIEPAMLRASFALSWDDRCPPGQPKLPLIRLLARSIPQALIDRPASSFRVPYDEIFGHPTMQAFVRDVALSPQNPLLPLCCMGAVRKILARAESGKPLSVAARRFLWAFVFVSAWIQQVTAAP